MADNVELNAGTGGATLATDDVVGVHFQKVKIDVGGDGATAALSNSNPLPVSDAGGSLTVDNGGTFAVQAAQSGTWNVTNVSGTVSLPTGAATAAKQPALGTAGTASADVISVQGIASMTPLDVAIASGGVTGRAEDAAHASGHEGLVMLAVRRDTAAVGSDTDGDYSTVNVDANGRLHCNVGNTVTVASHAVTNAGTFAVQVDGSALTALQLLDNASIADDAAFTPASTGVTMAGFTADETATDSVDEGDGGAARMTLDRKQIVTPYVHAGAGGATPYYNLDCDETEDAIKATAGKLFWIHVVNLANAKRYIKFYNATTANVTVGTTTPVLSFPIPTMGDTNGAGFTIHFGAMGVQFDTAITVAATTGLADNDTGAPGANEIVLNAAFI